MKDLFPIFKNNPGLVYLDSASTSQKPQRVIDSISRYYSNFNANVHRGLYPLSEKSTEMYEEARTKVANFINASPEEIIFTAGTTDGVNAISRSLARSGLISQTPKILLTELEHHSNLVPWQQIKPESLTYLTLDKDFDIGDNLVKGDFDILGLTHVSNVTGTMLPVKKIIANYPNTYSVLDAAQSAGHFKLDVKNLGVDFMVFSGHKMYGPTGIGVIYGKKELLNKMEPFNYGGGMIREVKRERSTWAELPQKFEAGTPPIAEAVALAEAIDFIQNIGFESIEKSEETLRKYLLEELAKISSVKIYHPGFNEKAGSVISLSVDGAHPHDLSQFLGEHGVCVRAGHHCTQVLHREVLNIPASLRVSFGIYNDTSDVDKFIKVLRDGINFYIKG